MIITMAVFDTAITLMTAIVMMITIEIMAVMAEIVIVINAVAAHDCFCLCYYCDYRQHPWPLHDYLVLITAMVMLTCLLLRVV